MFDGANDGIHGNAARMIETLKQAWMTVVLVLLSEGLSVMGAAWGPGEACRTKPAATAQFLAGATLCSSGLMLLYPLGGRDEK
jgi:hypothetical protein